MSEVTKIGSAEEIDKRIKDTKEKLRAHRAEQRQLFPEHPEGMCDAKDMEQWKTLLARATNHANRNAALKKIISKTIADREKYFRLVASGLAEAIRDKSSLPLQHHLGSEWQDELEDLEARDKYHDSLRVWMQENEG